MYALLVKALSFVSVRQGCVMENQTALMEATKQCVGNVQLLTRQLKPRAAVTGNVIAGMAAMSSLVSAKEEGTAPELAKKENGSATTRVVAFWRNRNATATPIVQT